MNIRTRLVAGARPWPIGYVFASAGALLLTRNLVQRTAELPVAQATPFLVVAVQYALLSWLLALVPSSTRSTKLIDVESQSWAEWTRSTLPWGLLVGLGALAQTHALGAMGPAASLTVFLLSRLLIRSLVFPAAANATQASGLAMQTQMMAGLMFVGGGVAMAIARASADSAALSLIYVVSLITVHVASAWAYEAHLSALHAKAGSALAPSPTHALGSVVSRAACDLELLGSVSTIVSAMSILGFVLFDRSALATSLNHAKFPLFTLTILGTATALAHLCKQQDDIELGLRTPAMIEPTLAPPPPVLARRLIRDIAAASVAWLAGTPADAAPVPLKIVFGVTSAALLVRCAVQQLASRSNNPQQPAMAAARETATASPTPSTISEAPTTATLGVKGHGYSNDPYATASDASAGRWGTLSGFGIKFALLLVAALFVQLLLPGPRGMAVTPTPGADAGMEVYVMHDVGAAAAVAGGSSNAVSGAAGAGAGAVAGSAAAAAAGAGANKAPEPEIPALEVGVSAPEFDNKNGAGAGTGSSAAAAAGGKNKDEEEVSAGTDADLDLAASESAADADAADDAAAEAEASAHAHNTNNNNKDAAAIEVDDHVRIALPELGKIKLTLALKSNRGLHPVQAPEFGGPLLLNESSLVPAEQAAGAPDTWLVQVPPRQQVPARPWDVPIDPSTVTTRSANLSWSEIQLGLSTHPKFTHRVALLTGLWARNPEIQWTPFWCTQDDPEIWGSTVDVGRRTATMHMEDFFQRVGRYPAVIEGDPENTARSPHVKWFKMIPTLLARAPATTKWFVIGDDDTLWYPPVLMSTLRSIDADPMTTSIYLGDVSELPIQVELFGEMAFGGGGAVVSRALAERMNPMINFCIAQYREIYGGDGRLGLCIELVTAHDGRGAVHLTRSPVFNQMDLWWLPDPRLYLMARFARAAPASMHHYESQRPLASGAPGTDAGLQRVYSTIRSIPPHLAFRRFMVPMGERTAVITFGFHVRIYSAPITLDHPVDLDSGIDVRFMDRVYYRDLSTEASRAPPPPRRTDYQDFWLTEYFPQSGTMVFLDEPSGDRVRIVCAGSHVLPVETLCVPEADHKGGFWE
ncbi:hypothetical protein H9P43_002401 [Blastocladiella emersonii ATCC 22665]|nr:hypothetical protein H9P43_002401 [Blastocladiella emersonii ATCC 22665]